MKRPRRPRDVAQLALSVVDSSCQRVDRQTDRAMLDALWSSMEVSMHLKIERPEVNLIPMFTPGATYVVDVGWKGISKMLEEFSVNPGLELEPDFQRIHVWDDGRRRRYVEYILRGGSTAKELLFNCPGWNTVRHQGPILLVDGKQRLEAVRRFLAEELAIFGGWKLSDFSDTARLLRNHLAGFKVHINDLGSRADVLRWYLDINGGSVAHTKEELRRVQGMLLAEDCK